MIVGHRPMVGETLRRIVLRYFALRVHPDPVNDNSANERILERLRGMPAQPATAESEADPNRPER